MLFSFLSEISDSEGIVFFNRTEAGSTGLSRLIYFYWRKCFSLKILMRWKYWDSEMIICILYDPWYYLYSNFKSCIWMYELSLDRQFEPYLRANTVAPSWCGLGCRSRTLMVEYISPLFFLWLTLLSWYNIHIEKILQNKWHFVVLPCSKLFTLSMVWPSGHGVGLLII